MANPANITTYALLTNAIEDHLDRTDMDDEGVSALCVQLAEAEFDREIRHHKMRKRSTATMDSQYTDLPDDWISPITIRLITSPVQRLQIVPTDELLKLRARGGEAANRPQFVSTQADTLEVFPTPNDTYTVEMHYWARIPKLSATNTSNWLLASYPDVYLYGSLCQAEPYLRNDERLGMWRSLLERGYGGIKGEYNESIGPAVQRWPVLG